MKNNSILITAFTVATGLVSSAAMAGVDASTGAVGATADRQHVKMLTEKGPVDDVIDWGVVGTRTSSVTEIQNLQIQVPAVAEVPLLSFLEGNKEIRRDVIYRPFESAAAFAPVEFSDRRGMSLARLYPDDPAALLKSRERPAFVIAAITTQNEFIPAGDRLTEDGSRTIDLSKTRLAAAEMTSRMGIAEGETTEIMTADDVLALLKSGELNEEQYMAMKELYARLSAAEREEAGIGKDDDSASFSPDTEIIALVRGIKDAADRAEQDSEHTYFHVGDKVDVPFHECSFSPCGIVYLTPHDVWEGGIVPDRAEFIVRDMETESVDEVMTTVPLAITITDITSTRKLSALPGTD